MLEMSAHLETPSYQSKEVPISRLPSLDAVKKSGRRKGEIMIDLTKFCSTDSTRFNIQNPFSLGEFTYATDGNILIRVDRLGNIAENPKAPDCERLFAEAIARAEPDWMDLPEFKLKRDPCLTCKGTGYLKEGTKVDIPCAKDFPGAFLCTDNCADGVVLSGYAKIDGVALASRYLDLIKDLPGIKISVFKPMKPVRIKFDGGEGLIMPMMEP